MTDIHVTFTDNEASVVVNALLVHCDSICDSLKLQYLTDDTRESLVRRLDRTKDAIAAIRNAQAATPLESRRAT